MHPTAILRSPRTAWTLLALLYIALAYRGLRLGPTFDFEVYWRAAVALGGDGSLYELHDTLRSLYFYGPVFAILCRPLSYLSLETAHAVWTVGSVGCLLFATILMRRVLDEQAGEGRRCSIWAIALGTLIIATPLASNFRWGNSNTMLLLLLVAGLWCLARGKRFTAGIPLALAAVIKVTPMLLLVWLLMRREMRAATGFAVGILLFVVIIPVLYLGPQKASSETQAWVGGILVPALQQSNDTPVIVRRAGLALPRVLDALLTERTAKPGEGAAMATPQLASLSTETVQTIGRVLSILLVLLVLWFARRDVGLGAVSFGLVLTTTLLVSPSSHLGQWAQLLPLAATLAFLAKSDPDRTRSAFTTRAGLTVSVAVLVGLGLMVLAKVLGIPTNHLFPVTMMSLVLLVGGLREIG